MKKRIVIFLLLVIFVFGCSAQDAAPMEDNSDELIEMTMEEVAQYNGQNSTKTYVVVDGEIYDVSDHPQWSNGSHGGNMAGTDITDMLVNNAAHGKSKLSEITKIGRIVDN